jgi:hypothetical protein
MGSANDKMWKAVETGKEDLLKEALQLGADVNGKRDKYHSTVLDLGPKTFWTPLHCAGTLQFLLFKHSQNNSE